MLPQMLDRSILVITFVTGIVQSLENYRPNTYWSKRSVEDWPITEPGWSNNLENDKSQPSLPWANSYNKNPFYTINPRQEIKGNKISQTDGMLRLLISTLTTLVRQSKHIGEVRKERK